MSRIIVILFVCACLATWTGPPVSALEMEGLNLADGRNDENTLKEPVLDAASITLSFTDFASKLAADDFVVYRLHKGLLAGSDKRPKPHYKLASDIDLGSLLADALRSEAAAMGFSVDSASSDWSIAGTIHDLSLEIKVIPFGATLFYAHMDVGVSAKNGLSESPERRLQFHNLYQRYNAGFGLQDEAKEALARFLVDTAQELVARLNRELFHALPHADIAAHTRTLDANVEDGFENRVLVIGLSGSEDAVPKLLDVLRGRNDEGDRRHVLSALGNIGSPEVINALAERYDQEDEDCRLMTLKAMDYIAVDESLDFVKRKGTADKDLACRRLSQRLR